VNFFHAVLSLLYSDYTVQIAVSSSFSVCLLAAAAASSTASFWFLLLFAVPDRLYSLHVPGVQM